MTSLEELFGVRVATAVVTGGTSGLGAASALALARADARVIVSGRDRGRGERVVDEIQTDGGEAELELAPCCSWLPARPTSSPDETCSWTAAGS
jgi:NAD(P)-dependent dehydrogenase (short-subunit alcohol dehydrogenase family)